MTTVQAEKITRRKLSLLQLVLRGLQGRDRPEAHPHGQEGGEESSVGPDLGEAGCRVITVLVQLESTLTTCPRTGITSDPGCR